MTVSNAVKVIKNTDSEYRVGGYGIVFGGQDLDGDTFTKDTDFWTDKLGASKLTLYQHGADGSVKQAVIGNAEVKSIDDVGMWIEAQLDMQGEYFAAIRQLVDTGALGWSSGAISHLVSRDVKHSPDGHESLIKSWPIIEFSLTPNPAEPRTLGVEQLKQIDPQIVIKTADATEQPEATAEESTAIDSDGTQRGDDAETVTDENIQVEADEPTEETMTTPVAQAENSEVKSAETQPVIQMSKSDFDSAIDKAVKAALANEEPTTNGGFAQKAASVNIHASGKTGDGQDDAFKSFVFGKNGDNFTLKASNATDMNIGTAADGGNTVPTGMYNQIIARRDESLLAARLPIMRIPGTGTTVDVPLDSEADGEFVATNEAANFDLDSPAIGKKSLTLLNYSKYIDVSYQLLEDSATNIEAFLAEWVGRGMAKTHNSLLLTEVAANGTNFATFAGTTAIAFGEPEEIVANDDLSAYLEDEGTAAWVMRNSTKWAIRSIVGNDRQYYANQDGSNDTLLGYPVYASQKAGAMTAGSDSVFFGNWRYVGMREGTEINFIRDPYTVASKGQVRLLWNFRTVYGVLQSEAIGYADQAAS